jgi:hypothetical protein
VKLNTPAQLTAMLDGMVLEPERRLALHRRLANHTRRFFRGQIRQQRDIDGAPYQPRSSRNRTRSRQEQKEVFNTKSSSNMFMGLSRAMKTYADDSGFEVGLTGLAAKIAREHNEGATISFTTRVNGFYDAKTNRWGGGRKQKNHYRLPKRAMIGFTPALERELMAIIGAELLNGMEN